MDLAEFRRLSKSKFCEIDGVPHKSCPQCSLKAEDFVYHPSSTFGKRKMPGGPEITQSWCKSCLAEKVKEIRDASREATRVASRLEKEPIVEQKDDSETG